MARHAKKSKNSSKTPWVVLITLCLIAFIVGYLLSS